MRSLLCRLQAGFVKKNRRLTNESSGSGEIPGTRLDGGPSPFETDLEAVPAVPRHAARRITHEVALPELFEDAHERGAEIRGLLQLEQAAAAERRQIAQKVRFHFAH